eukprot:g13892.t1
MESTMSMQIFVKNLTGRTVALDVDLTNTVEQLKDKVQDLEGIPSEQINLLFSGHHLTNSQTLDDYGIEKGSTVEVMVDLLGGSMETDDTDECKPGHSHDWAAALGVVNLGSLVKCRWCGAYWDPQLPALARDTVQMGPQ